MKLNIESPLFQFLTTLSEFILLNIIFLLSCLPVFTIGASITALYYVTMQEAREDHGYIARNYFKSFKKNFRQATVIWILFMIIGSVLLFNLKFWQAMHSTQSNFILVLITIASVIFCISFLFVFPLLARFENNIKLTIQNSIFIAIHNFKFTLPLIVMNAFFIFICIIIPQAKIFMILLGFAFFAYCNSFLFVRIFKKYEPENNSIVEDN